MPPTNGLTLRCARSLACFGSKVSGLSSGVPCINGKKGDESFSGPSALCSTRRRGRVRESTLPRTNKGGLFELLSLQHKSDGFVQDLLIFFIPMRNRSFSSHSTSNGETTSGDSMTVQQLPSMCHDSTFLSLPFEDQDKVASEVPFALVILNHSLPLLTSFLWNGAALRICADGGANQLYDVIPSLLPFEDPTEVRKRYKPDVIKGDLDSIRPEVKDFYAGLGTRIIDKSYDQSSTDLWKCLSYIKNTLPEIEKGNVKLIVAGALGGRLDHEFANVNALYLFPKLHIILLSDESMAFLLPKGFRHEICINPSIEGPHCGLLPLGSPSTSTTTTGLKWNLDKSSMQFGGLISTSNIIESNRVTVQSDSDLVWTVSLQTLHGQLQSVVASRGKSTEGS